MGGSGQHRPIPSGLTAQILSGLEFVSPVTHYRLAPRLSDYELLGVTTGKTSRSTRMGHYNLRSLRNNRRTTYRYLLSTMGSKPNRRLLPTTTPTPFKPIF